MIGRLGLVLFLATMLYEILHPEDNSHSLFGLLWAAVYILFGTNDK